MKKEQARRWLAQKLKSQQQITQASVAGFAILGVIAWSLELAAVTLVLMIGFRLSSLLGFLTAAGILGGCPVFHGTAAQDRPRRYPCAAKSQRSL
ncbi:MAG UNVERIFIED_CONTAM: hypothetical protein LVR18_24455 [Planctomycetaceae bacterium]